MKFETVQEKVKDIPFIQPGNAKILYDLIVEHKIRNVLELGIAHGTATCFIAAAFDEIGGGNVDSVDLISAKDIFDPSVEDWTVPNVLDT